MYGNIRLSQARLSERQEALRQLGDILQMLRRLGDYHTSSARFDMAALASHHWHVIHLSGLVWC